MTEPCCPGGPPGHTQQQHHDASPCYDANCQMEHPRGGPFRHPEDEEPPVAETRYATISLFKPSGKYYSTERWRVPEKAVGPWDMGASPDFRRIAGGPVLVEAEDGLWGYPHLFPAQ